MNTTALRPLSDPQTRFARLRPLGLRAIVALTVLAASLVTWAATSWASWESGC